MIQKTVDFDETSCTKEYHYSGEFDCLAGHEFFDVKTGVIDFEPASAGRPSTQQWNLKIDHTYRSRLGFGCVHRAVIYGNTNYNINFGMRRLTSLRFAESTGKDARLARNQARFVREHAPALSKLADLYEKHFKDYDGAGEEAWAHSADPHIKRLLRMFAWRDLEESGGEFDHLWVKYVTYKMKKDEFAKTGKYPRMIGDLGVAASLQGFRITEFLKQAQAKEIYQEFGCDFEFVKSPAARNLEKTFRSLIEPEHRAHFSYFSDDSSFSVRDAEGKVHTFNIDISSCDSSHGDAIFESLLAILPGRLKDDMQRLLDQCKLPIRVHDVNSKNFVTLQPHRYRLYSGSTITTAINNLASFLIGLSIAESGATTEAGLIAAAEKVGYVITCKENTHYSQIQFLKHSPVYDTNSELRALLNFGVMIRSSGVCHGDVVGPKGMTLQEKAENYQANFIQGCYPKAHTPFVDSMRRKVVKPITIADLEYKTDHSDLDPHFFVSDEEAFRRYGLDDAGIAQVKILSTCSFGEFVANPGLNRILNIDYDLDCC
jgi:hypothetical protein